MPPGRLPETAAAPPGRAIGRGRGVAGEPPRRTPRTHPPRSTPDRQRGKTIRGAEANAGHRVAPTTPRSRPTSRSRSTRPPPTAPGGPTPPSPRAGHGVVVLDFGSQFAQLIARRVRELDVYSELLPHDTPLDELERRGARGDHPVGRPELGLRRRRAEARPRDLERPPPGPRHLLRRPADGPRAGRRRHPVDQARVRPGDRHDHRRTTGCSRPRARAAGLDEPRRLDHPPARGLPAPPPRPTRRRSPAWPTGPQPVRHPVPPRGRPHAARPRRPAQLRPRHRRRRARLDAGQLHRVDGRRHPRARRRPRRDRLGRQGHLRAVGRRRLGGRGGARPSRGRRPADVHLRRPRADAQEGVGAAPRRPSSATSACTS